MPERERRSPIPPTVRRAVMERAGHRCEKCGRPAQWSDGASNELNLHHHRLYSEGGPDTEENLIALCPPCHQELHLIDFSELFTFDQWMALPPVRQLMIVFAQRNFSG